MDIRIRAVILSTEGIKTDKEIISSFGILERTLRRWKKSYKISGINGLNPSSTKPVNSSNQMPKALENRIISLKQKYPSWGARRIHNKSIDEVPFVFFYLNCFNSFNHFIYRIIIVFKNIHNLL